MNGFTDKIHSDTCSNRGNIKGAKKLYDAAERIQHILFRDNDFCMVASYIIRHLFCIFQINGVFTHADCKGPDCFTAFLCRHGADKGRIQTARQQKPDFGVRYQPLLNPCRQFLPDLPAHSLQVILTYRIHLRNITVADERSILIIMSRRKRHDPAAQPHKVFRLAGKHDYAFRIVSIIEGTDPDGIPCRYVFLCLPVVDDARKFRVQHAEHIRTVFLIQRQQNLAVRIAFECIFM